MFSTFQDYVAAVTGLPSTSGDVQLGPETEKASALSSLSSDVSGLPHPAGAREFHELRAELQRTPMRPLPKLSNPS